jgi:hypothetical protein
MIFDWLKDKAGKQITRLTANKKLNHFSVLIVFKVTYYRLIVKGI